MERKIGEVFKYDGKAYMAVMDTNHSCSNCAFVKQPKCTSLAEVGLCSKLDRKDRTDVVFAEVTHAEPDKAREPIEGARRLIEGSNFDAILKEMSELHKKKNTDYGNAFADSFKEFGLVTAVIRLNDKMNRLKSLAKQEAQIKGESIRDTLIDLACYAVMTIEELDKTKDIERKESK